MRDGAYGWSRWLLVSAAVVAADLASKAWIGHLLAPGDGRDLAPFLRLVLVYNTGAAFSFLAGAGGWQRWFFTAVAIVISVVLVIALRRQQRSPWVATALALVLGGALGNLWDRLALGHVVDFVLVHWNEHMFPAFNVADSAITIGVVMLLAESLWPRAPATLAARREEP